MSARLHLSLLIFGILLLPVALISISIAQIEVSPVGLIESLEPDDSSIQVVELSNETDREIPFEIKYRKVDREDRRHGPVRDDFGDVVAQYRIENGRWYTGIAWDGEEMWGYNHNGGQVISFNPENERVTERWNAGFQGVTGMEYAEGEIWIANRADANIHRFDMEGRGIENLRVPQDVPIDIAWDGENIWYTSLAAPHRTRLYQIDMDGELLRTVQLPDGQWDGWASLEFVEEHPDGQMWIRDHGRNIYQLNIEEDNARIVQTMQRQLGNEFGLSHDGENLWYTYDQQDSWIVVDDGVAELYWLNVDLPEGVLNANETTELEFSFNSVGVEAGTYEFWVDIEFPENENYNIRISAVLSVDSPVASIFGSVTDASNDRPIDGATASLDYYRYARQSDAEGAYEMASLPLLNYQVTFTAPDFLPTVEEVGLDEEGLELNIALLHSECNLSREDVIEELAPGDETHVNFSVSNDGNGPLTYTIERQLLGDANAAPWELRREYSVAQLLQDDRIEGVAFDGENFYFSGANGDDPNTIYITDRDGEPVDEFVQPGESRYGMKDIEWDGELLWGSGEQNVYGFDTDGNVVEQFAGPANPTNCLAYDPVGEILWLSGTTTNIAGYTREGEATGVVLNRKNLRIYGLAYWPDDPDGYPLYILNQPAANTIIVHKMNPANGDTLRVMNLQAIQNATPGGAFICNTYDVYSWVMIFINNIPPNAGGDKNFIYQLDARKEWFLVDPVEGVIEPDGVQEFDLHLNAVGLPAVTFEGELLFTHDGIGGETRLPVTLDVVGEGDVRGRRDLELARGWNLVSVNVNPDETDIPALTGGLVEAEVLEMVKDDQGHFYRPDFGFSNMDPWNVAEGYLIKVREPAQLSIAGIVMAPDEPIDLLMGWQSIAYYPRQPVDAVVALSGIRDQLVLAKDGVGNFYLPAFGFSNMGDMREGRGYQVRVSEDVQLVYRLRQAMAEWPPVRGIAGIKTSLGHSNHPNTGSNMSLLVRGVSVGDGSEVGVYAGGQLRGSGVMRDGLAGIAVWGDDPTTPSIDGALESEELTIRLIGTGGNRDAAFKVIEGEMTYMRDGLAVIEVESLASPIEFGLMGAWPNPFNSRLTAQFGLESSVQVKVGLFDLSGREVLLAHDGRLEAGSHRVTIDGDNIAAGLYILRVESASGVSQMKVALVK